MQHDGRGGGGGGGGGGVRGPRAPGFGSAPNQNRHAELRCLRRTSAESLQVIFFIYFFTTLVPLSLGCADNAPIMVNYGAVSS